MADINFTYGKRPDELDRHGKVPVYTSIESYRGYRGGNLMNNNASYNAIFHEKKKLPPPPLFDASTGESTWVFEQISNS